jgi:hypothetical protein
MVYQHVQESRNQLCGSVIGFSSFLVKYRMKSQTN